MAQATDTRHLVEHAREPAPGGGDAERITHRLPLEFFRRRAEVRRLLHLQQRAVHRDEAAHAPVVLALGLETAARVERGVAKELLERVVGGALRLAHVVRHNVAALSVMYVTYVTFVMCVTCGTT